jgi:hypothetical protein
VNDWGQLKGGVSFSACVSCNDDVTCEVQTLEEMMGDKFISDVSEEEEDDDGGGGGGGGSRGIRGGENVCPATF